MTQKSLESVQKKRDIVRKEYHTKRLGFRVVEE